MLEPLREPEAIFLAIMAIILVTPLLSERVHLPGIIGLILGGIVVGPHGLGLLDTSRTIVLLSTVGLIYLMFSAGLEIDLHQFGRVRNKALLFGLLTFSIPQLSGIGVGRLLGLDWQGAVLLGSIYASHTLVAFPLLSRLGILRNEAVSVTVGATVFTDVAALLVLATVAGSQEGNAGPASLAWLILLMIGYAALVLLGLPRAGKLFFQRYTHRAVEFQFVLVALFVAALLAERIGMHAIVGAFLAGLAINSTLPHRSPVIGQVLFVGESFFVPVFMMYIGMVTDPLAIVASVQTLAIGIALTGSVYLTKFLAAWLLGRTLGYSRDERLTMWGLSQAQAAATLATILVGTELGLLPMSVFNGAILMILLTSITSPLLVQRFGSRLHAEPEYGEPGPLFDRILVPIANPQTQEHLITLAGILAQTNKGTVYPVCVARRMNGRIEGLDHQQEMLERAGQILDDPEAQVQPLRRVDVSVAKGILHTAIENRATLIVMGWRGKPRFALSLMGTILDEVVWGAAVPVLVGRLTTPINALHRVVLIARTNSLDTTLAHRTVEMATAVAEAVRVPILILAAPQYQAMLQAELDRLEPEQDAKVVPFDSTSIQEVANSVRAQDLLVVTTMGSQSRFRSSLGHFPEQLAAATPSSIVVVHYP